MAQTMTFEPVELSESQLDKLRRRVCTVAEQLSDAQILLLADSLHETLRSRRRLRARVHLRVEERLGQEGVHQL